MIMGSCSKISFSQTKIRQKFYLLHMRDGVIVPEIVLLHLHNIGGVLVIEVYPFHWSLSILLVLHTWFHSSVSIKLIQFKR